MNWSRLGSSHYRTADEQGRIWDLWLEEPEEGRSPPGWRMARVHGNKRRSIAAEDTPLETVIEVAESQIRANR